MCKANLLAVRLSYEQAMDIITRLDLAGSLKAGCKALNLLFTATLLLAVPPIHGDNVQVEVSWTNRSRKTVWGRNNIGLAFSVALKSSPVLTWAEVGRA